MISLSIAGILASVTGALAQSAGQYASVNGLKMYYEVHGSGKPLVLIHGGGSTIESTFGRVIDSFAKTHRVIAVELQAHGHSGDRNGPISFEQDADDVAELLNQLKIEKADFFGFSNGGTTCFQIAIRHPRLVNKLIVASAAYNHNGMPSAFWESFKHADIKNLPADLRAAFIKANPDPKALQAMFDKCAQRMENFKDIPDATIRSITAPALIIQGDAEVIRPEHALEMLHTLPHARLAIIPAGHGEYIGEADSSKKPSKVPALVVQIIEEFLDAPMN